MKKRLPSIIVTGASGFIGRHVVDSLKNQYSIFAIARRSMKEVDITYHKNIHWIQWDISNKNTLSNVVDLIKSKGDADFIIHLAAFYDITYADNPEYERTNVRGTKNVLELGKQVKIKHFIFASSLAACNFPQKGTTITEQTPIDADFAYAKTKKIGEEMLHEYSNYFKSSVLRFAAVYSEWCEYVPLYKFLQTWLSKKYDSRFLGGHGNSAVSYIHIHDCIQLIDKILNKSHTLPAFDVYNVSPDGCTTHKELFKIATRDYYGKEIKPIFLPKLLAYPGVLSRIILSKLRLIKEPFEKLWMVQYIDLQLNIDSSHTCKTLSWKPNPRYHILRRLLFLLVNMKSHPNEWKVKNEAAMKHVAQRPNFVLYEHMIMERREVIAKIVDYIMAPERNNTFANYQKMDTNEFRTIINTLYHLLMASVRSNDKSLLIKYIDEITLQRFIAGFEPAEICNLLTVFNDITTSALLGKKELKNMKQLMYDFFSMSLQMAKDEIEDIYENLEQKLSGEKIKNLASLKYEKEKQKMITQLSSFYQDFPSG